MFSKSKLISLNKNDVIEKDKIKDEQESIKIETKTPVAKTPAYRPNSPGWSLNTPAHASPEWKGDTNVWRASSPGDE